LANSFGLSCRVECNQLPCLEEESLKKWYVVNIKPKKESYVEKFFAEGNFTLYNPKRRHNGDRCPLFPGYAFILMDYPAQYKTVKYTRGVKTLLGDSQGPIPVPPEFILEIKNREKNGIVEMIDSPQRLDVGDNIEVTSGPLRGIQGIFQKNLNDNKRVSILLNYVSYQAKLTIEKSKISKQPG
jgi:transcriptional antiterminator RfaH